MKNAIRIHSLDNVCVLLRDLRRGDAVDFGQDEPLAVSSELVPAYHKIACRDLTTGELIVKYGAAVGRAAHPIACGMWVNEENIVSVGAKPDVEA